MNIRKAERLAHQFDAIFTVFFGSADANEVAPLSVLPRSKTEIVSAIKVLLAAAYNIDELKEIQPGFVAMGSRLSRFVDDAVADNINRVGDIRNSLVAPSRVDSLFFDSALAHIEKEADHTRQGILRFLEKLKLVGRDDPLLMRKAYILIGIPYEETEPTLWDFIREACFPSR